MNSRLFIRWNRIARRKRRKLDAPSEEEAVRSDKESVGPVAYEGGEGCLDLTVIAGVEDLNL